MQPRLSELGEVSAPRHSQLDLASQESIRAAVRGFQPNVIINAAAYTAVDLAESQPDLAMRVNALAILFQRAIMVALRVSKMRPMRGRYHGSAAKRR